MTSFTLALVLLSCVSHAGWNLVAKQAQPGRAFFLAANLCAATAALPLFALWGARAALEAPRALWLCLAITGVFQALYFVLLARAYQSGDLSLAYPLARTSPIFVAPAAGWILGEWPAWPAAVGILLTVAGCFLLAGSQPGAAGRRWARLFTPTAGWALLTAVMSAGYTLTDSIGVRAVRHVAIGLRAAVCYGFLEWVFTTACLAAVAPAHGGETFASVWRGRRRQAVAVGVLSFATYLMVLWAFTTTRRVEYIAAARQFSIVLGVLAGVFLLREPAGRARIAGACVITAGLVLVAACR